MRTAIVVGGGIVGTACALRLQSSNLAVTQIDPLSRRRSASWGNAGHLAFEQVEPWASWSVLRSVPRRLLSSRGGLSLPVSAMGTWAPFALRYVGACGRSSFDKGRAALRILMQEAAPAWGRLAADLSQENLLRPEGHYIVWSTPETAARGKLAWSKADIGAARIRDAEPDELQRLSRAIGRPLGGAVRCLGTGQISDPTDLATAMRQTLLKRGGILLPGRATSLKIEAGRAWVGLCDGVWKTADALVVAAGIGSRSLMESIGCCTPLIAERGYHVQYPGERWSDDLPPVVFEDYALIVTRFRSGMRVASHFEFASAERPPNPKIWKRLRHHARNAGLPVDGEGQPWMGARPTLPDYLPAIGRSSRASNLFYAFGHQHLGLTLGPVTGEIMSALTNGRTPPIPLTAFELERFH